MANNKSAKKRIKINKRNQIQNNSYKSLVKTSKKMYLHTLEQFALEPNNRNLLLLRQALFVACSQIDKAKKKNVLEKNTANRKKSNLWKTFAKAQVS